MSLEKITTQQMDAKGVCAAPDILNGTPAQNKSIFDRMVRELIAPAYNAAVDAIAAIEQTESGIEAAEALRVAAENLRASAETAREQAESGRITAEEARAEAESLRASAEELRTSAEQARAAAEQNRAAAEQNRVTAEQGRATAEQNRVAAEQARASAETERDAAEQAREAAETARADENTGIVARATEKANIASSAAASAENNAGAASSYASAAASDASRAAGSAYEASVSETRARASETAARNSETAAKASETAAKTSETTAKSEADRAKSEADRAAGIVGGDYATKTDLDKKQDKFASITIPKGRMRGDVDGDGVITNNDASLLTAASSGNAELDDIGAWCAKTRGNSTYTIMDAIQINKYVSGSSGNLTVTPTFADYYENWTYVKVNDLTGYWTADIEVPEMTTDYDVAVIVHGKFDGGMFYQADVVSGGLRIYSSKPPIEDVSASMFFVSGSGKAIIVADSVPYHATSHFIGGGDRIKPEDIGAAPAVKLSTVTLSASGWDSTTLTQTIEEEDVTADETSQIITPIPAMASRAAYYNAGVICTGQADYELTFTCKTIPTEDLTVYVAVQEVGA